MKMNISQEKEHLYKLMHSLLEERRLITEELLIIRKRINKLNDFQEIGINDIPAIDYIRLKKSLDDMKYELSRDKIKAGHDAYKQSMYSAPPQNTYAKPEPTVEQITIEQEESWEDITPEQPAEPKKEIIKPKKTPPSYERTKSIIVQLLKEAGGPVDIGKIRSVVEEKADYKFKGNRLSMALWQLKKENDRVTQPARGFYQYLL